MVSRQFWELEWCEFDSRLPDCVRDRYWLAVLGCEPRGNCAVRVQFPSYT